jgi:hypothetical protein
LTIQKDAHFRKFKVTRELRCPHVKDDEDIGTILKSANTDEVDDVKLRRNAREGKTQSSNEGSGK